MPKYLFHLLRVGNTADYLSQCPYSTQQSQNNTRSHGHCKAKCLTVPINQRVPASHAFSFPYSQTTPRRIRILALRRSNAHVAGSSCFAVFPYRHIYVYVQARHIYVSVCLSVNSSNSLCKLVSVKFDSWSHCCCDCYALKILSLC